MPKAKACGSEGSQCAGREGPWRGEQKAGQAGRRPGVLSSLERGC